MVMETHNPNLISNPKPPPSMRVLVRPPPSSPSTSTSTSTLSLPYPSTDPQTLSSSSSQSGSSSGVVVVGFIGRRPSYSSQLINRVIDSNVFGSGNLDKVLCIENEEVKDWFKRRKISYYFEEQKGVLFLQFTSTRCPAIDEKVEPGSGFDSVIGEHEFGDLQGMLFMFSVCHVIIFVQEGSHFDTQLLRKFRVLQAAKHSLAPLFRSQATFGFPSRSHSSSSSSRPHPSTSSSSNSFPSKNGSILNCNASAISLMSGLGSYTFLFPGQCTPVMLLVFIDDLSDVPNPSCKGEESTDTASHNQSSSLSSLSRPSLPVKGSGSIIVLARPGSKSDGGFRKKLQSSLEAQVRFLIKKCRTLSGSEASHSGSRSGGPSGSAPLFSLDASRAVVLLDRSVNLRGESLEFATSLVEDVLNGRATTDSLLLESHGHSAGKEDITSMKEFIYRQSDILRGKSQLVANSNSGSAAGIGMVAIAAAAAAASTASGKTISTFELPDIENWLSSSQLILHGVLSAKGGCLDEIETSKRKPRIRNNIPRSAEGMASKGLDPLDVAVSWLESGKGLNTKFSTLWCERMLPAAKEVYLKDLPACYPTALHEGHLEKALCAFHSMVKGAAVQNFAKKLEDECIFIWKSGRQLCDAVSLTGKPCMHQRHNGEIGELDAGDVAKSHSSGYVFLHACACGRSRKLRPDPFDFESANIPSSCFPDCDKLLPMLQLPKISNIGPIQPSSWSLIRVGSARYYEPSKGLLQSGFCSSQKFLLKLTILLERQHSRDCLIGTTEHQGYAINSSTDTKSEPKENTDTKNPYDAQMYSGEVVSTVRNEKNLSEDKILDKKISFGKGLPNFSIRKPFSEVVAGSANGDSRFPHIQQRKQHLSGLDRSKMKQTTVDQTSEQTICKQEPQKPEDIVSAVDTSVGFSTNSHIGGEPHLQVGSNVVPVNLNYGERNRHNSSFKRLTAYVGFEHECAHGHRFLLGPEHLDQLGTLYQLHENFQIPATVETSDSSSADPSGSTSKSALRGKVHRAPNRMNVNAIEKARIVNSKEMLTNGYLNRGSPVQLLGLGKVKNQSSFDASTLPNSVKDLEGALECINFDDGGCAFSMLNRNIPIFMNCPHCRLSKNKDPVEVKFAGTVSQLQRIFVVTPSFPVVLATCPLVQFEASCLPPSVPEREQKLQFSLGCQVVLPPDSFLSLRLPFVYGLQLDDGSLHPLNYFEGQPEVTAWIAKGTTMQILSKRNSLN